MLRMWQWSELRVTVGSPGLLAGAVLLLALGPFDLAHADNHAEDAAAAVSEDAAEEADAAADAAEDAASEAADAAAQAEQAAAEAQAEAAAGEDEVESFEAEPTRSPFARVEDGGDKDPLRNDYWLPSVLFSVNVHDEQLALDGRNELNTFEIDADESRTVMGLRLGGELMSPVFEDVPLKPRFVASLGVLWSPPGNSVFKKKDETTDVDDFRDFNLGQALRTFENQFATNPNGNNDRQASDFEGQGNRVWGRQRHNAWFANVGAVFTIPRKGYSFRFRSTLEYMGEVFDHEGQFILVDDLDPDPTVPVFNPNRILLSKRETYHSLGPGLELELVNQLESGVILSFFMQTHFMWIVNDPGIKFEGEASNLTADEADDLEGRFEVERDRFNFRGGMGIRLGFKNFGFQI